MAQTDPDPALEWELRRAGEAGVFQPGELLVETELAGMGRNSGALVVTDRRVLFVSTGLFRRLRKMKVTSVDLPDIQHAETRAVWGMRDTAGLVLTVARGGAPREAIELADVSGGLARATQIAESIFREQARLRRRQSPG